VAHEPAAKSMRLRISTCKKRKHDDFDDAKLKCQGRYKIPSPEIMETTGKQPGAWAAEFLGRTDEVMPCGAETTRSLDCSHFASDSRSMGCSRTEPMPDDTVK